MQSSTLISDCRASRATLTSSFLLSGYTWYGESIPAPLCAVVHVGILSHVRRQLKLEFHVVPNSLAVHLVPLDVDGTQATQATSAQA